MSTERTSQASPKRMLAVVGIVLAAATIATTLLPSGTGKKTSSPSAAQPIDHHRRLPPGSALPVAVKSPPNTMVANFGPHSVRPDSAVSLRIISPTKGQITLGLYRAGHGKEGQMHGAPVGKQWTAPAQPNISVSIGNWPSGLYYMRLSTSAGLLGYAPFVLRPKELGEHSVAVVLPTNTWQSYNYYDADRDGKADSWYGNGDVHSVDLNRPFLDRGVPPHFRGYDLGFLRWLTTTNKDVDFLSDDDLEYVRTGDLLAAAYDLIVFSGHEEYVTTHGYDITERYRDLGGNLAFLSANNFFYKVSRRGNWIEHGGRWRDLGRPEASLVGAQYVDWYQERYPNRPYVVVGTARARWLFNGSGLAIGSSFGNYGIEIDAPCSDSPKGILTLATIPNIFGPGKTAAMTYYTTKAGAKVFDAGVINFGGSAMWPKVSPMIANLWAELSKP
jgi:hypothetical protein